MARARSISAFFPICATARRCESAEAWRIVVLDGALEDNGMASFATVLDAEAAEAIRAFVIAQAHATGK